MPLLSEMPFALQSDIIQTPHVILNRENGVSPAPFRSRNISYGVGDNIDNVSKNRQKIKKMLGLNFLASAQQIHGERVYTVGSLSEDMEIDGYDALITQEQGIGLLIQQADCQAILLHDPVQKAIGAIHCGWRGSVLNIIGTTIQRLQEEFGTEPDAVRAVISPSLGPCCAEFIHYQNELPPHFQRFQTQPAHFDFQAISREQLIGAGIAEANIEIMKICTVCDKSFFSHRRATKKGQKKTGRQGSVICLAS